MATHKKNINKLELALQKIKKNEDIVIISRNRAKK
jgi:hypothetical protein